MNLHLRNRFSGGRISVHVCVCSVAAGTEAKEDVHSSPSHSSPSHSSPGLPEKDHVLTTVDCTGPWPGYSECEQRMEVRGHSLLREGGRKGRRNGGREGGRNGGREEGR